MAVKRAVRLSAGSTGGIVVRQQHTAVCCQLVPRPSQLSVASSTHMTRPAVVFPSYHIAAERVHLCRRSSTTRPARFCPVRRQLHYTAVRARALRIHAMVADVHVALCRRRTWPSRRRAHGPSASATCAVHRVMVHAVAILIEPRYRDQHRPVHRRLGSECIELRSEVPWKSYSNKTTLARHARCTGELERHVCGGSRNVARTRTQ